MYLKNLRYRLSGVVDSLVIVAVNTHTWVVDPIVTFGTCILAFGGLRIPLLTVKALSVIVTLSTTSLLSSLQYLKILLLLLLFFHACFFLSSVKIEICYCFFPLSHSFAVTNSFLCSKEVRIGVLHLFHDTFLVLPSVWDWNDFCGTLKRKNWHQMFFSCRPTTRYLISFWIFAGARLLIWCCTRCRPMESLCVQCGVKYGIITLFSLALFMNCKLFVWDLCPSSRRSTGDSFWAENHMNFVNQVQNKGLVIHRVT